MTTELRPVSESDLPGVLALNNAAVPALNELDAANVAWFSEHAAVFDVAVDGDGLVGFLIGLTEGSSYGSPNYGWFRDRYERFVYVDRVAVRAAVPEPGRRPAALRPPRRGRRGVGRAGDARRGQPASPQRRVARRSTSATGSGPSASRTPRAAPSGWSCSSGTWPPPTPVRPSRRRRAARTRRGRDGATAAATRRTTSSRSAAST